MPLTSVNAVLPRFDTRDEHCETSVPMTPPERPTVARTPAAAPATGPRRQRAWSTRVQRVQRESLHDDGWLMAVELVTATLTWGGIGWLVDHFWLHTYPIFMSIGFVVGFFAGMYLLWLKTSREPDAQGGDHADA